MIREEPNRDRIGWGAGCRPEGCLAVEAGGEREAETSQPQAEEEDYLFTLHNLLLYYMSYTCINLEALENLGALFYCTVWTPSRTALDKEAPNQEEYKRQRQARILAREVALRQQQEELYGLMQKIDYTYEGVERRHLEAERPWPRKVHDLLTESSDGVKYFLSPEQNMVAAAMMLPSIPEPDEPEAKVMYQNLRNLVERTAVLQVEIDWQPLLASRDRKLW
jgi:hypothetical protein